MNKLVKTIIDGGVEIWYQWNDLHIGQRIALGKYEPYLTKLMIEILKQVQDDETVFVDVGANIGYYSLLAAKKGARVIAIEPEKTNFEILEKNVKKNGLEKKIKMIRAGAGRKNTWAKIEKSKVNFGAHKLKSGRGKIKIIRLDDVIKEKVEVIKIDVEGMEGEVVAGAKNLIKKWQPTIIFEYGISLRNRQLIKFLSKIYGEIYAIDEYCQMYWLVEAKKLEKFAGNLMVKKNLGWEWGQIKNVDWRKVIKKYLVYNQLWRKLKI